jgi:hypothetical protein
MHEFWMVVCNFWDAGRLGMWKDPSSQKVQTCMKRGYRKYLMYHQSFGT